MRKTRTAIALGGMLAVTVVADVSGHAPATAPQLNRCLKFNRPLGGSANGEREKGDSAWYTLELTPKGGVTRRRIASNTERMLWEPKSHWQTVGDTVSVRVWTGTAGWQLTLLPTAFGGAFQGWAHYVTEPMHLPPVIVPVRATLIECSQ